MSDTFQIYVKLRRNFNVNILILSYNTWFMQDLLRQVRKCQAYTGERASKAIVIDYKAHVI
jgi:hypothetical protein